jgi:hypothetical protein
MEEAECRSSPGMSNWLEFFTVRRYVHLIHVAHNFFPCKTFKCQISLLCWLPRIGDSSNRFKDGPWRVASERVKNNASATAFFLAFDVSDPGRTLY